MNAQQPKRKELLKSFLEKFGITTLNPMQIEARKVGSYLFRSHGGRLQGAFITRGY